MEAAAKVLRMEKSAGENNINLSFADGIVVNAGGILNSMDTTLTK